MGSKLQLPLRLELLACPATPVGRYGGTRSASLTMPSYHLAKLRARQTGASLRSRCVSLRLSASEHDLLAKWAIAERKQLGRLAREILFGARPRLIPEINYARWEDHARTLANLNQLAYHLNAGRIVEDLRPLLQRLLEEVQSFRAELRGQEEAP